MEIHHFMLATPQVAACRSTLLLKSSQNAVSCTTLYNLIYLFVGPLISMITIMSMMMLIDVNSAYDHDCSEDDIDYCIYSFFS